MWVETPGRVSRSAVTFTGQGGPDGGKKKKASRRHSAHGVPCFTIQQFAAFDCRESQFGDPACTRTQSQRGDEVTLISCALDNIFTQPDATQGWWWGSGGKTTPSRLRHFVTTTNCASLPPTHRQAAAALDWADWPWHRRSTDRTTPREKVPAKAQHTSCLYIAARSCTDTRSGRSDREAR